MNNQKYSTDETETLETETTVTEIGQKSKVAFDWNEITGKPVMVRMIGKFEISRVQKVGILMKIAEFILSKSYSTDSYLFDMQVKLQYSPEI